MNRRLALFVLFAITLIGPASDAHAHKIFVTGASRTSDVNVSAGGFYVLLSVTFSFPEGHNHDCVANGSAEVLTLNPPDAFGVGFSLDDPTAVEPRSERTFISFPVSGSSGNNDTQDVAATTFFFPDISPGEHTIYFLGRPFSSPVGAFDGAIVTDASMSVVCAKPPAGF